MARQCCRRSGDRDNYRQRDAGPSVTVSVVTDLRLQIRSVKYLENVVSQRLSCSVAAHPVAAKGKVIVAEIPISWRVEAEY